MKDNDMVLRLFKRLCFLAMRKTKALGLREQHVYQRLEDGSYSLRLELMKVDGESTSTASSES